MATAKTIATMAVTGTAVTALGTATGLAPSEAVQAGISAAVFAATATVGNVNGKSS